MIKKDDLQISEDLGDFCGGLIDISNNKVSMSSQLEQLFVQQSQM